MIAFLQASKLRRWLAGAGLCALAIWAAMAFLDHPLAQLFFSKKVTHLVERGVQVTPNMLNAIIPAVLALGVIFALTPGDWRRRARAVAQTAISVAIAYLLVSQVLKPLFGRSGPMDWIWQKSDRFYFFGAGSDGNYFFPSSHAALFMAAAMSLGMAAPSWRRPALIGGAAASAGLVALNLHFLSDVIAGGFIGASIALLVAKAWPENRPAGAVRI